MTITECGDSKLKKIIIYIFSFLFVVLDLSCDSVFSDQTARVTPGNIYALTLPDGNIRVQITAEEFKEKDQEVSEDVPAEALENEFSEQVYSLELSVGLTNNWELGILLPYTDASVDVTNSAGISEFEASDDGLGNVRLIVKYGHQIPENRIAMLTEFEVGVPTDTRNDDLKTAGDANLAFTVERFWERLSVNTKIIANYRAEEEFSGGEVTEEIQLGISYVLNPKLYTSATAIHDDDLSFLEVLGSYQFSDKMSIEIFATMDLNSDRDIKFYGITLSNLFY